MAALMLALALASPSTPSAEAQRLGYELAQQGTLAAILPLAKAKDTEELIREDPGLSPEQQAKLRVLSERIYQSGYERLMKAMGDSYARHLSVHEMRSLIRFNRTAAAARYRQVMPEVIAETMTNLGKVDLKEDVRKAFCADTQRLCTSK